MLIESKIKRPGGTIVEMEGQTYHFKPQAGTNAHICDVLNRHHVQRFLAITEGYAIYADELPDEAKIAVDTLQSAANQGDRRGIEKAATELTALSDDFDGMLADPNAGSETAPAQSKDDLDAAALMAELTAAAPAATAPTEAAAPASEAEGEGEKAKLTPEKINAMSEEELRAEYAVANGRPAPGNTKPETLRDKLIEFVTE